MSRTTIILVAAAAVIGALLIWLPGKSPSPGDDARNTPNTAWLQEVARGEMTKLVPVEGLVMAPDLPLTDDKGQVLTLADFRGQLLLINFWATWCAPCRAEMPSLDRLHQSLAGDDFQVIAISIDRQGPGVVRPFLDDVGVHDLPVLYDPKGALSRAWGVFGLPVTILVDKEGREVARMTGPAEWDSPESEAVIRAALDQL